MGRSALRKVVAHVGLAHRLRDVDDVEALALAAVLAAVAPPVAPLLIAPLLIAPLLIAPLLIALAPKWLGLTPLGLSRHSQPLLAHAGNFR